MLAFNNKSKLRMHTVIAAQKQYQQQNGWGLLHQVVKRVIQVAGLS
jgi:KaiC/GvpD/RAD55 family RecA-like ATPase